MISNEPHSAEVEALLESFYQQADRLLEKHLLTLWKKREQIVYVDDYGVTAGLEKWYQELRYFRDKVMLRDAEFSAVVKVLIDCGAEAECGSFSPRYKEAVFTGFVDWIENNIRDSVKLVEVAAESPEDSDGQFLSGVEYEMQCAGVLEKSGWLVARKGKSGDQGVDLVASLGNLRVAIQCKRYSQPVGNKAVQEVSAGKKFEKCDVALVVSNASYTPAARRLASVVGVILLHDSDLPTLRQFFEQNFSTLIGTRVD